MRAPDRKLKVERLDPAGVVMPRIGETLLHRPDGITTLFRCILASARSVVWIEYAEASCMQRISAWVVPVNVVPVISSSNYYSVGYSNTPDDGGKEVHGR